MSHRVAIPGYWITIAHSVLLPVPFLLLLNDLMSLLAAFIASVAVTEMIQTRLLNFVPAEFYAPFLLDRLAIVALLSCLLTAWFAHKKHYTGRRSQWTEVKQVLLGFAVVALTDGWVHFALKMQASRLWQFQLWLYAVAFVIGGRFLVRHGLAILGLWQQPTLLIGESAALDELHAFARTERYLGYEVLGRVVTDGGDSENGGEDHVLGRLDEQLAGHLAFSHALVACQGISLPLLGHIVDTLECRGIRYGIVPPLRGVPLVGFEVDHFLGHDFILLQRHPQFLGLDHMRTVKRGLDLVGASFALLLLSPLMLAVAALLWLEGGPVLYRSRRLGHRSSMFSALKFRTMRLDADRMLRELLAQDPAMRAEWEAQYKLKDDPRITRFGNFLRRTSIDELPQLFNVLRGEMSLVGPRPLLLDEVPHHESGLHLYTSVLPGITGIWQVSGRGEVEYARRLQLNNWYVHNWSLWHDVVILLKTLVTVARRRGAS